MRLLIQLSLALLLAKAVCFAQPRSTVGSSSRLTVDSEWTLVQVLGVGTLDISVLSGEMRGAILGAKVIPGAADHLEIADIGYATGSNGRSRASRIGGHPTTQISVTGGNVTISGGSDQRVLVYAVLSSPRTINLSLGSERRSYNVMNSLVVSGGAVSNVTLVDKVDFVLWALLPGGLPMMSSSGQPIVNRNGEYAVLDEALIRSRIAHYSDFGLVPAAATDTVVGVMFSVKPDGTVEGVRPLRSDLSQDLRDMIVATVSRWSFHPFEVDRQVVPMKVTIQLLVTSSGAILSGLSPNVR
jgi:hypothetical protein